MTPQARRSSKFYKSDHPVAFRKTSGTTQPQADRRHGVSRVDVIDPEPVHYPQPSSSLPSWIDNLAHAEQPIPAHPEGLSASQVGEGEDMSWELRTETVGNAREYHESSMAELQSSHARQLAHYKNLLIRAQSASSTALHELHTQLHQLQTAFDRLQAEHDECARRRQDSVMESEIAGAIGGSDLELKVRSTGRQERMRLLGIIADACNPSDVAAQIALLEKYKRTRFDILGRLETDLAILVMSRLAVPDILNLRLVSKRHHKLTLEPALWLKLCQLVGEDMDGNRDAALLRYPSTHWETIYRGLHQRERNWRDGQVQHVKLLSGHTDYVTSLKLRGDTLVSGSYDGTVRVWHIPRIHTAADPIVSPTVIQSKSVSCLDYWPEKQVIATGHHDLGRVQIWKRAGAGWEPGLVLSGHLHGIRAIAMNDRYLISAGADKAIVVWDYETGEKFTRFGQQTNICVGIHLVHDKIVSVTVDGVIRAFDIARRQMIAQYRLGDLCKSSAGNDSLRAASVLWAQGSGAQLTCGTKSAVVQLKWEDTKHETRAVDDARLPPVLGSPITRKRHISMGPGSPASAASTVSPLRRPAAMTRTPTKRISSLNLSTAQSGTSPSVSPRATTRSSPMRRGNATTASSSTLVSSSPTQGKSQGPLARSSASHLTAPASEITPGLKGADIPRLVPNLSVAPTVLAIIDTPEVERGAIDDKTGRIVLSQRFASRSGAGRNLFVVNEAEGVRSIVPLGGAWADRASELGLASVEKNPMSLVINRDRIIYGCTDGAIVLSGFPGL